MEAISNGSMQQLNTALFIDFDNIYLNLAEQDKTAAEKFATAPDIWLDWLEQQLPLDYRGMGFNGRRILIRRCYLNPNSFARFRPHFIRSACEVVDCPPLTARGKTSTDIHLVMDALESLSHKTYFHEFIIFSGDADFTPLLLNLRKHARYSVVLPIGLASPAYKASCDFLINSSTFIETVLGVGIEDEEEFEANGEREIVQADKSLLKKMAEQVHKATMVSPSGVPGSDLPAIYKQFHEFKQSNHWLGFFSLKKLTEEIVKLHDDLAIVDDEDSWLVTRKVFANWVYSEEKSKTTPLGARPQELRTRIAEFIRNMVADSSTPIVLSALAHGVQKKFADQSIATNYLGAMTFKNLLQQLDLGYFKVTSGAPGYIYDPDRHHIPVNGQAEAPVVPASPKDTFQTEHPEVAVLAKKIHKLTDMPYLAPQHYGLMFREIAREVNDRGYQMTQTSRTVRDRCIEKGAPIARSHVDFVLTGLNYVGHNFGAAEPQSAMVIGDMMRKNTINLCRAAQFELSEEEDKLVEEWLISKIEEEPTAG